MSHFTFKLWLWVVLCAAVLVQPGAAAPAAPAPAGTGAVMGTTQPVGTMKTMAPPDPCDEMDPECVNEPANCHATLGYTVSRASTSSRIGMDGYISCYGVGYVYVMGGTRLVDRTSGHDGNPLGAGLVLSQPVEWGRPARSTGTVELQDTNYPAGNDAEVVFAFTARQEYGVWNGCGPATGGIRIIRCDGAGTSTLTVEFGTGTFSTQLAAPLFIGSGQGDGCSLSMNAGAQVTTIADGEHRAAYSYQAAISCTPGVTGNSHAELWSRDRFGRGWGNQRMGIAGESGANGTSSGNATLDEHEDGGRRVIVFYTGRTVAPAGRAWAPCKDASDGGFRFLRCTRDGNTVTWEAESRPYDFPQMPDELHCRLDRRAQTVLDSRLTAGGTASCDGIAAKITIEAELQGEYTDRNGLPQRTATYPDSAEVDNGQLATADIGVNCDVNDPDRQVSWTLKLSATFDHPGGWKEEADPLQPLTLSLDCVPL